MSSESEREAFIAIGWCPSRRNPQSWRNGGDVEPEEREPEGEDDEREGVTIAGEKQ